MKLITIRKTGGLWHWKAGRWGGSVYRSKDISRKPTRVRELGAFKPTHTNSLRWLEVMALRGFAAGVVLGCVGLGVGVF